MMTRLVILLAALCTVAYGCPNIIIKSAWGAKTTNCKDHLKTPVSWVIIHHTTGASCNTQADCITVVKGFQDYDINKLGWCDIRYNFLVGNDGNIYEGRGWKIHGDHTTGVNHKSIGIAFIGDYQNTLPSPAAINAVKALISCGVDSKMIKQHFTLKGHQNVYSTECPGNALYETIKTWDKFKA